jgi:hypothetical protein
LTQGHLTPGSTRRLFADLPIRVVEEESGVAEAVALARWAPPRPLGDRLKRVFFKNARWELLALRENGRW